MKRSFVFAAAVIAFLLFTVYLMKFPIFSTQTARDDLGLEMDEGWGFRVEGLVENPINLTIGDLIRLRSRSIEAELYCVGNPEEPVTRGTWTGVELKEILKAAKPLHHAIKVAFYASDGYTTDLTLEDALSGEY